MILSSDYVQLGSTCTHYFLWPFEVSDCFILALPANGDLSRRERPPPWSSVYHHWPHTWPWTVDTHLQNWYTHYRTSRYTFPRADKHTKLKHTNQTCYVWKYFYELWVMTVVVREALPGLHPRWLCAIMICVCMRFYGRTSVNTETKPVCKSLRALSLQTPFPRHRCGRYVIGRTLTWEFSVND